MSASKKQFTGAFKAQVALEAIQGHKSLNEIASTYQVHPTQISAWKKQALEALPQVLSDKRKKPAEKEGDVPVRALYEQIGQLKVELDFLKKKTSLFG